jgi:hypothetical protein
MWRECKLALQGIQMLDDTQLLLPMIAGGTLRLRGSCALRVHLRGGAEVSLWQQNAEARIDVS